MLIVPSFRLKYNSETGVHTVFVEGCHPCPLCEGILTYRDRRLRKSKDLVGGVRLFLLRRLLCENCRKLHTEIPDIIQPYKHYDSNTIQSVLDRSVDALACEASGSTTRRWERDFAEAEADINQRLASVHAREANSTAPLSMPSDPVSTIRAGIECWLAFVMRLLINSGHELRTRFAFCPPPPSVRMEATRGIPSEGGGHHDKTTTDSG